METRIKQKDYYNYQPKVIFDENYINYVLYKIPSTLSRKGLKIAFQLRMLRNDHRFNLHIKRTVSRTATNYPDPLQFAPLRKYPI